MSKTTKNKEITEEIQSIKTVTFTRTYNNGEERFVRGQSYEVTSEYAAMLKKKGVI